MSNIIITESKVSGKEQMALVKELLSNTNLYMKCFATKDIYKLLYQCCGISAKCKFLDPIVAHWLYTNNSERNFNKMVSLKVLLIYVCILYNNNKRIIIRNTNIKLSQTYKRSYTDM